MAVNFEKLIQNMIEPLVTNPESVVVKKLSEDESNVQIQVLVDKEDLGRVIGRSGNIANAIRTIVYAGAAKVNKRVQIDIDSF